jgi:hypothetical protein
LNNSEALSNEMNRIESTLLRSGLEISAANSLAFDLMELRHECEHVEKNYLAAAFTGHIAGFKRWMDFACEPPYASCGAPARRSEADRENLVGRRMAYG